MIKAIRPLYEQYGAEGFYQSFADAYENPHEPEIQELIERNLQRIDVRSVLDFSAGSGEVTRALQMLGVTEISGSDPYTSALYTTRTQRPCFTWSFKDVICGKTSSQRCSTIISAFALHLCPEKDLFPLSWGLLQMAPQLLLITPHKRPELEKLGGIHLLWEDFVCTNRGKKVRMKAYGL